LRAAGKGDSWAVKEHLTVASRWYKTKDLKKPRKGEEERESAREGQKP